MGIERRHPRLTGRGAQATNTWRVPVRPAIQTAQTAHIAMVLAAASASKAIKATGNTMPVVLRQ